MYVLLTIRSSWLYKLSIDRITVAYPEVTLPISDRLPKNDESFSTSLPYYPLTENDLPLSKSRLCVFFTYKSLQFINLSHLRCIFCVVGIGQKLSHLFHPINNGRTPVTRLIPRKPIPLTYILRQRALIS